MQNINLKNTNNILVMKRVILKIFMVMAAVLLSCANLLAGSISWEVKDSVLTISGTGDMPDYPMGGGELLGFIALAFQRLSSKTEYYQLALIRFIVAPN